MKKIISLILILSTCFLVASCSNNNNDKEEKVSVKDMYGNTVEVNKNPEKIACVARNTYDFLIAFGLEDNIDGVYKKVLENDWFIKLNNSDKEFFAYEYEPSIETYIERQVDLIFSPEERFTTQLRERGLPALTVNHYGNESGYDEQLNYMADLVTQLYPDNKEIKEKALYWKTDIENTFEEITTVLDRNNITMTKDIHYVRADKDGRGLTYTENTRPYLEFIYRKLRVRTIGQDLESNTISVEDLLSKDPDYIAIGGIYKNGVIEQSKTTPYNNLSAVINNNIFSIPVGISQFEQPGSIASVFIKLQANMLYPDLFDYDIKSLTKESYSRYFNIELSDQDVTYILDSKTPTGEYA